MGRDWVWGDALGSRLELHKLLIREQITFCKAIFFKVIIVNLQVHKSNLKGFRKGSFPQKISCSKWIIETSGETVKYVQNYQ